MQPRLKAYISLEALFQNPRALARSLASLETSSPRGNYSMQIPMVRRINTADWGQKHLLPEC